MVIPAPLHLLDSCRCRRSRIAHHLTAMSTHRIGSSGHRDRRRDAGDGRALSRPHPQMGRRHHVRTHAAAAIASGFSPSPPRKRGARACSWLEQGGARRGPGALGSRFRGNDEMNARAIGDGLGRAAPMARRTRAPPSSITVEGVLSSRMVAYPFHLLQCCGVEDPGVGAATPRRQIPMPDLGLPRRRRQVRPVTRGYSSTVRCPSCVAICRSTSPRISASSAGCSLSRSAQQGLPVSCTSSVRSSRTS
jgi:hypothetical protein